MFPFSPNRRHPWSHLYAANVTAQPPAPPSLIDTCTEHPTPPSSVSLATPRRILLPQSPEYVPYDYITCRDSQYGEALVCSADPFPTSGPDQSALPPWQVRVQEVDRDAEVKAEGKRLHARIRCSPASSNGTSSPTDLLRPIFDPLHCASSTGYDSTASDAERPFFALDSYGCGSGSISSCDCCSSYPTAPMSSFTSGPSLACRSSYASSLVDNDAPPARSDYAATPTVNPTPARTYLLAPGTLSHRVTFSSPCRTPRRNEWHANAVFVGPFPGVNAEDLRAFLARHVGPVHLLCATGADGVGTWMVVFRRATSADAQAALERLDVDGAPVLVVPATDVFASH